MLRNSSRSLFAGAVRVIDDIGVTVYETTADRLE
jgi:hypothetical protein